MVRARVNAKLHPELGRLKAEDQQRLASGMYTTTLRDRGMWLWTGGIVAASFLLTWGIGLPLSLRLGTGPSSPWWQPFVIPAFAFAPFAAFWVVLVRRSPALIRKAMNDLGYPTCVGCGYDLNGIAEGRCPECGGNVAPIPDRASPEDRSETGPT